MCAKLFSETDEKSATNKIYKKLVDNHANIEAYYQRLIQLDKVLDKTESFLDFYQVVEDMIQLETSINAFLRNNSINKLAREQLISARKNDETFKPLVSVLNAHQIIARKILENKERLNIVRMKEELPEKNYKDAMKFIDSIHAMKPLANVIEQQKTSFTAQLDSAETMEQVNNIENKIDVLDSSFKKVLESQIDYPQDEATAGAIIKFLETNEHLKDMIASFNFAESLVDEVMNSKVRLSENLARP